MLTRSTRSLLSQQAKQKTIPAIESRIQFARALDASHVTTVLLRHCNLFDFRIMLEHAYERELAVYVNVDHIDGITPDTAGLRYLARQLHITGIVSSNARILALAKNFDLETVQRIFAVDSTGLEVALESVDSQYVDLLDISPALVIPYAVAQTPLELPFIGSGFISTPQQVQMVLRAGAVGVTVARTELWT
ncbi:MAG TPA: glycerol-3-phosphate responsive antiterminator [Ktedonobacteraceae bacterium]|nr:glycerol-3-phosphate responsive antiterminator [Ktedonobacteraceae bacterium]